MFHSAFRLKARKPDETHPTKEWAVRGEMMYRTKKKLKNMPCKTANDVTLRTTSSSCTTSTSSSTSKCTIQY